MQVSLDEAKAKLSALIENCRSGEEVIIAKSGKSLARLVQYEVNATPCKIGLFKDKALSMGEGIHDGDAEIAVMFGMEN